MYLYGVRAAVDAAVVVVAISAAVVVANVAVDVAVVVANVDVAALRLLLMSRWLPFDIKNFSAKFR